MTAERRSKVENPVGRGRPSVVANGGFEPTPDIRVRQPLMAKESLCGNQPANLSLVIAVLRFPPCFAALPYPFRLNKEDHREKKY
jgi:hypothetical protein